MKRDVLRAGLSRAWRVIIFSLVLLALVVPAVDAAATRYWVKRYNGTGNDVDEGAAIAFDKYGNAYVAGRSVGFGTDYDYLIIKYGPNGGIKWLRRYDGTAGTWDGARGIVVDDNGNVYVTGRSFGPGTHGDLATVKYNSAGAQLWVRRYTSAGYHDDGAMDMALDSNGNVIVTGFSTGSGSAFDFVTIKYGPDGTTKWVKRYDGPDGKGDIARGIAVDSENNVYVTGPSRGDDTSWDYATIKYSPAGAQLWVMRWNSGYNESDGATDIAVDMIDFPYVTGYTYRSGGRNPDFFTIKYNRNGVAKWWRRYNGPANGVDAAWAIAIDNNGVYVAGTSEGKGTKGDYATIRYYRWGDTHWVRRYSGPERLDDVPNAVAAANNRVYVTGYRGGTLKGNYFTIAYGGGGGYKWANAYNGSANDFDQGNAVGVCPATGDVYVTGGSRGVGTKSDIVTIKYAP